MIFKVGDKVRRKAEARSENWYHKMSRSGIDPCSTFRVLGADAVGALWIQFGLYRDCWASSNFELADSKFDEYKQRLKSQ